MWREPRSTCLVYHTEIYTDPVFADDRVYGVQAWLFFQDASQLSSLYPDSWPAIVNNCSVVQMFGAKNQRMAKEFAGLIGGIGSKTIMKMPRSHQAMLVNGEGPFVCQRPNYLADALYRGSFDPNPMYARRAALRLV